MKQLTKTAVGTPFPVPDKRKENGRKEKGFSSPSILLLFSGEIDQKEWRKRGTIVFGGSFPQWKERRRERAQPIPPV